jgi:hypothetical protein
MESQNEATGEGQLGWTWVGSVTIDSAGRCQIPQELVAAGVLDGSSQIHWGYEEETGTVVISTGDIAAEKYLTVAKRSRGGSADGHRSTVPHQFSAGMSEQSHIDLQTAEPSLDTGDMVHFVYHDELLERDVSWCFVLTTEQLEARLLSLDDWPESAAPNRGIIQRR